MCMNMCLLVQTAITIKQTKLRCEKMLTKVNISNIKSIAPSRHICELMIKTWKQINWINYVNKCYEYQFFNA